MHFSKGVRDILPGKLNFTRLLDVFLQVLRVYNAIVHVRPAGSLWHNATKQLAFATVTVVEQNSAKDKTIFASCATWRWRDNKLVMFTSCFRLPPFSNSSQFNAKCEAEILNGTRTCLCQGSDCNINPTEPVTPENKKQALGIESSEPKRLQQKREYRKFICDYHDF